MHGEANAARSGRGETYITLEASICCSSPFLSLLEHFFRPEPFLPPSLRVCFHSAANFFQPTTCGLRAGRMIRPGW